MNMILFKQKKEFKMNSIESIDIYDTYEQVIKFKFKQIRSRIWEN